MPESIFHLNAIHAHTQDRPARLDQVEQPSAPPARAQEPAKPKPPHAEGETHARTIVKSLTWRFGGLLMTVATDWIITGVRHLSVPDTRRPDEPTVVPM